MISKSIIGKNISPTLPFQFCNLISKQKYLYFLYFQCTNGHLMCASCFSHLLADARLKDESSTCPNCRCEISKNSCSRNLAVEKTISELPTECQYCSRQLPRNAIRRHELEQCQERCVALSCLVRCKTLHNSLRTIYLYQNADGAG